MSEAPGVDPLFLEFQEVTAGQYSLQRELGRGGMGVVYLAREMRLDRPVAIKLLPPELAAHGRLRDRFMREARTAAQLTHPHIVPIHTVDEARGFVFYVMAYVDGETLAQRVLGRGPMPPAEASRVLREVAGALSYAHAQGVVHRDIKPANILLERGSGRAMVTDFGIARLAETSGETAAGELLGTPEYMSPEQAAGEAVDARSDVYSLGIVGYYTLTGSLPFSGPSAQSVLAKQLTQTPPPVATVSRGIPQGLAVAIDACLVKDPAHRIQSGEALAAALTSALEKRAEVPIPVRNFLDPRRMWTLAWYPVVTLTAGLTMLNTNVVPLLHINPVLAAGFLYTAFASAAVVPVALITKWLRPLLRLGYGPADIAAGLRAALDRRREEYQFELGAAPSVRERVLGAITLIFLTGNVAAWTAIAAGATAEWLPTMTFITGSVALPAGILSATTARVRAGAGSWWAKRWEGAMGRWLTRLASINLGPRAAAADRPTETVIALSAEALFAELPRETRRMLGDVPEIVKHLEAQARKMRERIEELAASIAQHELAGRGAGSADARAKQDALLAELRLVHKRAEARFAELVAALETTRLDLLRLRAGHGSTESITQDLQAARALGEDVSRLLAGHADVEAALRSPGLERTPA